MRKFVDIGMAIPETLLPRKDIDLNRWSVIACDQFTSQPEYWENVRKIVGDSPSTYNLVLPEVFLGKPEEAERLKTINRNMQQYLDNGILVPQEGMIYVERTVAGKTRKGLLVCLDLEKYDFNKGSTSLIRATEGTILDRLPPRIKIRENAALELPHILVLIDDPEDRVIGAATQNKPDLPQIYDFDLMLGSGHLSGWLVDQYPLEQEIVKGLQYLADSKVFAKKYGLPEGQSVLLFAMGDGNHSLATAKAIWDRVKSTVGMDHPSRYALVELENVHDAGLEFEPIHRILFGVKKNILDSLQNTYPGKIEIKKVNGLKELESQVERSSAENQRVGYVDSDGFKMIEWSHPPLNLPVGNLQSFLDAFLKEGGAESIDYVHGSETVFDLGQKSGNAGFYLPAMDKSDLFKTVILDGALPRKTFSMGEAKEKRFYLEARKIK